MKNSIVEDAPPNQARSEWRLKTHSRGVPLHLIKEVKTPTAYCLACEAFTSDNDAMIEYGSEFPYGGQWRKCRRKSYNCLSTSVEKVPSFAVLANDALKPTTEIAATVSGGAEQKLPH